MRVCPHRPQALGSGMPVGETNLTVHGEAWVPTLISAETPVPFWICLLLASLENSSARMREAIRN